MMHDEPDRVVYQHKDIPFIMCGQSVDAKTGICVMAFTEFLLLVQEDKVCNDPEPQLIAGAIPAFYQNNLGRARSRQPPLASKVFPRNHDDGRCSHLLLHPGHCRAC
ncbi:hypothetical protein DFS33DRAFT_1360621 [Desarmillaria ectypa]|nr:hypothetical protein DFS33DRAFT_1360621 [Desarmillaria ectypa]